MPSHDFVKTNDILYSDQLTHFAARLPSYVSPLSLIAADTTAATNDAVFFAHYLTYENTVVAYGNDLVKGKKQIRSGVIIGAGPASLIVLDPGAGVTGVAPGIDKRFRALVARIKAHPNYSVSMGTDLGIEGINSPPATAPPSLKGTAEPHGLVRLVFRKLGNIGVSIESERGSEVGFSILASPLRAPYVDNRANVVVGIPEVRKYKYRYLNADGIPTGAYSTTLEITTEP